MRTRTGRVQRCLCFAGLLLLCLAGPATAPAAAGKKEKKPTVVDASSAAILAGTVFTGVGFAFPGAEVLVTKADNPAGKDHWRAVSDARGEYFLRLPPGPAKYNVNVRAKGLKPQEKQITFEAGERLEQNFLLEPVTTGSGK